ncbi:unnamed protein product [Linum tenue]|uniref:Fe2OG dioxygenase domain-containing protein n=3 Tax=Linum tenue TaxID=586396 RepID=A0AAV0H9H4_9ROSI|nr:unnamed protein product [Linum tenue]
MANSPSMKLTSVQELVKAAPRLSSIPLQFLQQTQTALSVPTPSSSAEIPTVDYTLLASPGSGETELQKLHSACKNWGIFQVVNHGMSPEVMEKLRGEIEEFYELPLEEKMKYGGDGEGYGGGRVRANGVRDWGDRLYITTNPVHLRRPHLLPQLPSSLRDNLETYIQTLKALASGLLGSMEEALEMEANEMAAKMDDGLQSVAIIYYPPCPQPELVLGFTPHSDATCITILSQVNGVGGLQVKTRDGSWVPVNILPNALVVLVGDILEVFSNGLYESAEHRVTVNPDKERISMAFFVNPKLEAEIGPAASLVMKNPPCRFKTISTEQYFNNFFGRVLDRKTNLEALKIDN